MARPINPNKPEKYYTIGSGKVKINLVIDEADYEKLLRLRVIHDMPISAICRKIIKVGADMPFK